MINLDEMHDGPYTQGEVRAHYRSYHGWLAQQSHRAMADRQQEAEMVFRRVGITFAVYGDKDADGAGTERLIPFDLIPRIIPAHEWRELQRGLVQRVTARISLSDGQPDHAIPPALAARLVPGLSATVRVRS